MRFRPERRVVALLALCSLMAGAAPPGSCAEREPTQADIDRAVETVKADPLLAQERTIRHLKWEDAEEIKRKDREMPGWLAWIGDLFSWIAQASRLLLWLVIAALIALLALSVLRFTRTRAMPRAARFLAPTHVHELDIRPESLPPDIGAAARALWDRGESRAALALLYRGLLSRLAHVHEVPIRDSSTEGDCLALAARTLDARRVAFAARLVRVWQSAIYGGSAVDGAVVHELCAGFAQHLDARDGFGSAHAPLAGATT